MSDDTYPRSLQLMETISLDLNMLRKVGRPGIKDVIEVTRPYKNDNVKFAMNQEEFKRFRKNANNAHSDCLVIMIADECDFDGEMKNVKFVEDR